jgi:hypothetical protein
MYVLDLVETSLVKSPFWVIAITLLFLDPVYTDLYILVNAFIRRPAHCGPVHCKIHAGCVFNKVHGVRWAVRVLLPWLTSQCVHRPCLDNTSQTGFIFPSL